MRSYLFVRQVILVFFFLFLSLAACAPEQETIAPATRPPAEATIMSTATTAPPSATVVAQVTAEASPLPATPSSLPSVTPAASPLPSVTSTATPVPTLIPTIVLPPAATLPADLSVIAPENAATITQVAQFGQGRLDGIAWSADGATFAVISSAGIQLYDAATLQEVRAFDSGWGYGDVRFSPQGDIIAALLCTGEAGCFVELWQTTSGQLMRTLPNVTALPRFTPDGQTIIFEQFVDSETSLVWQDVHTGETQRTVQLELLQYSSHTLSPGGEMLAEVASPHTTVRLWDTASGKVRHTIEALSFVNEVAFSPQGDSLAQTSHDHVVRLWDVKSGQLLHALEGHTDWPGYLVFSPDGRILATNDRTVRLWDAASGQLRHVLAINNVGPMAFSPDGRQLAVVSGSTVLFYDTETGQLLRTLGGYNTTAAVAFSPDGSSLIAAGDYEVQTWDVYSGQLRQAQASNTPVKSIAFSPDGRLMAWGGGGQWAKLQMWDMTTGQLLYTLDEGVGKVYKVLFSPDGQLLATWSEDMLVRLRQAGTGEILFTYPANNGIFHPNGRLFAVGNASIAGEEAASVELWDMGAFELMHSLAGLSTPYGFSADGHIVASSHSATLGLWDAGTGELLYPFAGVEMGLPNYQVAALSPDRRILASSDPSGYLRLWDMSSGQALGGPSAIVFSVAFSPDGRLLATGNQDGTLSLWGVKPSLPASGSCVNDSTFVLDINVPDGTHLTPGALFTKTWRLRNSGTCPWDPSYRLNFISGEQMNGSDSTPLGETVPPGGEVDLSIDLIAPGTNGTYRGQWQLIAPDGTPFGAKPYVEIVVP